MRVLPVIDVDPSAPQLPPNSAVWYPMVMFLVPLLVFSKLTEALQFDVKKAVVEEIRNGRSFLGCKQNGRRPSVHGSPLVGPLQC